MAIGEGTATVLRRHQVAQKEEALAWGRPWARDGYLFAREDGEPMHPQTAAWHFEKAVRDAGVPVIRFHDMRHTYATIALASGTHPKVVQERLGHSSISITLDIYSHVTPDMQEEAAAAADAALLEGLG